MKSIDMSEVKALKTYYTSYPRDKADSTLVIRLLEFIESNILEVERLKKEKRKAWLERWFK